MGQYEVGPVLSAHKRLWEILEVHLPPLRPVIVKMIAEFRQ
jgi:hypothetical protein